MFRRIALALLLASATVAVYAPVTGFAFVSIDDALYVSGNAMVQQGLTPDGIVWAFTSASEGNWLPLTWLSHMLDVSLFGLDAGAHHRTSLIWHVLSSVLLFFVFCAMTGRDLASAAIAGLFALHPTHVESVAWVAERKDVLSGFFAVATLAAYTGWARRGGGVRYAAMVGLFALGLMSKSMLVTFPFVLLLLDVWPLGRLRRGAAGFEGWLASKGAALHPEGGRFREASIRELVTEKLPLFVCVLAVSAATLIAQQSRGAMVVASGVPLPERLANALVAWERYVLNTFWPTGLVVQVPHPFLPSEGGTGLSLLQIGVAALFLIGVSALALHRGRALAVGWFWFVGMLVPVIGIVQVGPQGLADRYTYLPAIGLYVAVVFGGLELFRREGRAARGAQSVLGVALLVFALLSAGQVQVWRESRALYRHSLQVDPGNLAAHYSLAAEYKAQEQYALASAHYRAVLERQPNAARAHNGLGVVLRAQGRLSEAATRFERALVSQPDLFLALNNLGNVQRDLGRLEAAERSFRAAIRREGGAWNARLNLATVLYEQQQFAEALELFEHLVAERPGSKRVRARLAELHEAGGGSAAASARTRGILEKSPADAEARAGLERLRGSPADGGR